ncbi:MAG: hypothetical protein ACRCXX_10180, partial [Cetobacterium sp.]|uniref:hypothetical protein n=1 Tax=Cetobacterium sp. TaxID=2071632 RepID=UPI003F2EF065
TFVTNEKLLECIPSVPHILLKDRHFILRWPVKTDWYTFDSFGLIHARQLVGSYATTGNIFPYQSFLSDTCGIYCLFVLQLLSENKCDTVEEVESLIQLSFSENVKVNEFNMNVYACIGQIGEEFSSRSKYPLTATVVTMAKRLKKN